MKIETGQKPEPPGALGPTGQVRPPAQSPAPGVARNAPLARASSGAARPVTVSIAAHAHALAQTADHPGDVDGAKVAAVRAAIDKGAFGVDARTVADKMLASARELLSRPGP